MERRESSAEIAAGLVEQAERLVRLEVELAKQEAKELAVRNGVAAGLFAGAGLLLMLALLVGVPVLIVVAVPLHWLAALIWIVVYVLIAVVLALVGRRMLQLRAPEKTIESLKETRNWALQQMKSPGR
jgi:Flp pilus assembly protein TadB